VRCLRSPRSVPEPCCNRCEFTGWSLVANDVDGREVASQARRLDQADATIREAIALVLEVDDEAFDG
jgi:hypothetical protein